MSLNDNQWKMVQDFILQDIIKRHEEEFAIKLKSTSDVPKVDHDDELTKEQKKFVVKEMLGGNTCDTCIHDCKRSGLYKYCRQYLEEVKIEINLNF